MLLARELDHRGLVSCQSISNTFDHPSAFTGTTEARCVNGIDQIVGSYQNVTGGYDFLDSGGTFLTAPQHP